MSLTLRVSMQLGQERVPFPTNLISGVLTSIAADGEFAVGDEIYAVDGVGFTVAFDRKPTEEQSPAYDMSVYVGLARFTPEDDLLNP